MLANCSSEPVAVGTAGLAEAAGAQDRPTGRTCPTSPTSLGPAAGATILVATHAGRTGPDLLPWESRVYEVGAPAV